MQALQRAHVMVVGVGGVGSWVTEALARSGVGKLSLVDWDEACYSNINRQIHAKSDTIGRAKVELLAERIQQINPECCVTPIRTFFSDKNADEILHGEISYVVDAIDSKIAKIHLITRCKQLGIPVMVSGGAGGRVDPSQVRITDLRDSYNDPLLAAIRKQLRRNLDMHGQHKKKFNIPCAFSAETIRYPHPDGGVCFHKPADGQVSFGAAVFVTGSFGLAMAAHIINDLVPAPDSV